VAKIRNVLKNLRSDDFWAKNFATSLPASSPGAGLARANMERGAAAVHLSHNATRTII